MLLTLTLTLVLAAQTAHTKPPAGDALPIQVMLDRAGFSPGAIDGQMGRNTQQALEQYKSQGGDPAAVPQDAVTKYAITAEDVNGQYEPALPTDLMAQSKLPALAYRSPIEAIAERFHTTPKLLQRLNPSAKFNEGEEISVPNVEPFVLPVERPRAATDSSGTAAPKPAATSGRSDAPGTKAATPAKPDVVVTVSKSSSSLTVKDADGKMLLYAPVTTGSEHDPLPIGEWKVNGVQYNPKFHYNPDLFWDANPSHSKAEIAAGPNNPVGVVWIDVSKPHYGLHGTPEPEAIGHVESHGCVRLTNWDAIKLASLVKPGTPVIFTE
jgi:lipoprotein-anchoring transpeptidase ErfK/SrfK